MKKILVELLSLVIMATNAIGTVQAQNGFSYQVVVRNADGTLVGDANVGMKFTLFDDTVKCYQESQTVTTNGFGVASMVIGGNGSKVLAGEFAKVPWSSMNIMMEVEADIKGDGSYVSYGKTQVNPAPYAMYAAATPIATEIVGGPNSTTEQELFSVKDKNGNVVFAVYPSGVRVYVDDDASKSMKSGFAVSKRHAATKDGAETDYLVVDASGTNVYIDADDSKSMKSGFAVSKRHAATKDSADADCYNVLTVNADGTQIYVDDEDGKSMKSGFAVSKRHAATKDADSIVCSEMFVVGADGTRVLVDDDSKSMKSGFAVSKRHAATKDGENAEYLTVSADGTTVFVDFDDSKSMKSGFAVSKRHAATKDDNNAVMFTVDNSGTQVYFDADDSKSMRSGFAVSGRHAATKDDGDDNIFAVGSQGTQAFIDDVDSLSPKRSFAVSGRNAGNAGSPVFSYLQISDTSTWLGVKGSNENPSFSIVDKISRDTMSFIADRRFNINVPTFVEGSIDYRTSVVDTLPTIHYYVPCVYDEGYYYGYDNISLNDLLLGYNSNDNWQIKDWNGHPELTSDKDTLIFSLEQDKGIGCKFHLTNKSTGGKKELVLYDANGYDAVSVRLIIHYYPVDGSGCAGVKCKRNSDGRFIGNLSLNLNDFDMPGITEIKRAELLDTERDSTEFSLDRDNLVINYKLDDNCYSGMWNLRMKAVVDGGTEGDNLEKVIGLRIAYETIDTLPDYNYDLLCRKNSDGKYEAYRDTGAKLPSGYHWESVGRENAPIIGVEYNYFDVDYNYLCITDTIDAEEKVYTTTLIGEPSDGGRYVYMKLNLRSIPCDYKIDVYCNNKNDKGEYYGEFKLDKEDKEDIFFSTLYNQTGTIPSDGYWSWVNTSIPGYSVAANNVITYTIKDATVLGKAEITTMELIYSYTEDGVDKDTTIICVVNAFTTVESAIHDHDLICYKKKDETSGKVFYIGNGTVQSLYVKLDGLELLNGQHYVDGLYRLKEEKFKFELRNETYAYNYKYTVDDTLTSNAEIITRTLTLYGFNAESNLYEAHNIIIRSIPVDFETQIFCSKNGDGTYSGEFPINLVNMKQLLNGRTSEQENNPKWTLESDNKCFSLNTEEDKVTFKGEDINDVDGYFKLVRNDGAKIGIYATIVYDSLPDVELNVLCMLIDPTAGEKEYRGGLSFNVTQLTHGLWNGDDCSIVSYAISTGDTTSISKDDISTTNPSVSVSLDDDENMSVSCTMGASDTGPVYNVIVYNKDLRQFFKLKIAFKKTSGIPVDGVSAWYIDKQNDYSESESEYEIFVNDSEEGLTYMCTYKEYHVYVQEEEKYYCYVLSTGNGNEMVGKMQIATGQTQQQPMQWKYDENGKWEDYEYDDVYPSWNEFLEGNVHNLGQQGRYVATLKFANEDRILHIPGSYNHHGLYLDHDEEEAVGMQFSDTMYIFTKQPEYDSDFSNDEDFKKCKKAFAGE